VPSEPDAFEAFETFDDAILVFLGTFGAGGVLILRDGDRWDFFGEGSAEWDDWHQGVYRNGRAARLSPAALAARGIALPALDTYRRQPPGQWTDRFPIEMPAGDAPGAVRTRVAAGPLTVHLILFEDRYETSFGDGKFLYPEAAFEDAGQAEAWVRAKVAGMSSPEERQWHAYTIKPVALRLDAARGLLVTDPQGPYERYGIRDAVERVTLA